MNGVTYYPIYAAGNNLSAGYNLEVDFIPMRNLWFANWRAANVSMIYYSNNTLAKKILNATTGAYTYGLVAVANSPQGVAITPNGQYVYVVNYGSATVSVISTSSNSVVTTITGTPAVPCDINYGPLGSMCWVRTEILSF